MTTVLLDTHVVHWWSSEPERLSSKARKAILAADELAVSTISWYELAWMAKNERIVVSIPIRSWLEAIAEDVRTIGITPAIADTAVVLASTFLGDPADRIIYATAVEHGWTLLTKDRKLLRHPFPRQVALW